MHFVLLFKRLLLVTLYIIGAKKSDIKPGGIQRIIRRGFEPPNI
jgi:hypothetical protein